MMMSIQEEERRARLVDLRQVADVVRLLHDGLMSPQAIATALFVQSPIDSGDAVAVLNEFMSQASDGRITKRQVHEFLEFYLQLEAQTRGVRSAMSSAKA